MFPTPVERTSTLTQTVYKIALPIALILWLLPLLAVALTSIRSAGDIVSGNYWGWPTSFNLVENYTAIFENTPIGQYILNSFKVTIPTVIGAVALSCMMILFHVAFQTGFCTLFMRNFIKALPFELIEAARVEGVTEIQIFWNVVLPLMKPAIAALAVLIFTFIWNESSPKALKASPSPPGSTRSTANGLRRGISFPQVPSSQQCPPF